MKKETTYDTILFKRTLPFTPSTSQLIYIEDEYNAALNSLLQRHLDDMQRILRRLNMEMCYLPEQSRLLTGEKYVRYFAPYLCGPVPGIVDSTSLNIYLKRGEQSRPAFILYKGRIEGGYYRFAIFPLNGEEQDFLNQFSRVIGMISAPLREDDWEKYCCYCVTGDIEEVGSCVKEECEFNCETDLVAMPDEDTADDNFPTDVLNLMQDVREKLARLRQHGVNEMVLQRLLCPEIRLSRLRVTSQNRIYLPGYNNIEIKMSPLVKAVYFLFLRHPEGIIFKSLPDYRAELAGIYGSLTGRQNTRLVMQSIIDVTDPYSNSINEKCARIREAFVREFDDSLARYYYISGGRGTAKSIRLARELVAWEGNL